MKKLSNKTFIVLFSILTAFSLLLIFILNYRAYNKEFKSIESKVLRLVNRHEDIFEFEGIDRFKPVFIDSNVYIVSFDNNMVISDINSYSEIDKSESEIKELAYSYIESKNKKEIGNLYFNNYAYTYNGNRLFILDISETSKVLKSTFRVSILLLIILEIIIFYICKRITIWLVKPVEEAFNKQKQFIYDASHELKTPIAVIMASAETLESDTSKSKWLDNIKNETDRMSKLVTNLLDLSKSEDAKDITNFENINLSKNIEMSLLTFESLVYEKKLKLDYKIDNDIMFKCDIEKIKQLLSILIDNAIKHSEKKSKIRVDLYKDKDSIYLTVKNKGEEIPKEERTKIFERFYRIDKSRNRKENRYGLGLAIAKNIVTNHNGIIYVECDSGYTTFIVNFKQIN